MVSPSASRNQWPKPRKRLKRTEDESMMIDAQSPISLESAQSITKSSPKTRATLHRIRFVDYQPPAVTSLALTPHTWKANLVFSYAHSQRQVLAVGKANGNIEIHVWIGDVTGSQKSNKQGWVLDRVSSFNCARHRTKSEVRSYRPCYLQDQLKISSLPTKLTCQNLILNF